LLVNHFLRMSLNGVFLLDAWLLLLRLLMIHLMRMSLDSESLLDMWLLLLRGLVNHSLRLDWVSDYRRFGLRVLRTSLQLSVHLSIATRRAATRDLYIFVSHFRYARLPQLGFASLGRRVRLTNMSRQRWPSMLKRSRSSSRFIAMTNQWKLKGMSQPAKK
jgi:hypothetical protein